MFYPPNDNVNLLLREVDCCFLIGARVDLNNKLSKNLFHPTSTLNALVPWFPPCPPKLTDRNFEQIATYELLIFGGHVEGEGSWGILFGRCEQTRFDWLQGVPWYMITCKEHGTWFYNQGGCESGGRWQKWVQSKHCIYKNSLYNKMRGWIFCRIYVLWNKTINKIYIYMQTEDKKLREPGIWKAKKFRCMWRSPFAPLLNFLNPWKGL